MCFSSSQVEIVEVAVDAAERLTVQSLLPIGTDLAHVYRAAMQVSWDPASRQLVVPIRRDWSQADWFKQVVRAVQSEYGIRFLVSLATRWVNVVAEDRKEIEAWSGDLADET